MSAYLDHAATTPMRPEAVEAMLPYLTEDFGNPSGVHHVARTARKAIEEARDTVAELLGAKPGEVVFTSGGTEADNLAVRGVHSRRGGEVVCSAIEHSAVLGPCKSLDARQAPVDARALIDLDALSNMVDSSVSLVSVMLANNEVGAVQTLADIATVVHKNAPDAVIHTDAVQAFPWLDVAKLAEPADLISVSAHKFGGPKGVGALVVRSNVEIDPLFLGGGHERERRSGTQNVAGIVAMAVAMRATAKAREATVERVRAMRDRLADGLLRTMTEVSETGDRAVKVAGNCHLMIDGVESEALLVLLDDLGICASAGSACASGAIEPSHVLVALGVPPKTALSSLRLSLGATTVDHEIDLALKAIPEAVAQLRGN